MANYFEDNPFFQSPFFKGDFFTGNAFFQSPFFGGAFVPENPAPAPADDTFIDMDGDGKDDTMIYEGAIVITEDSDSVNVDLDGDGVAELIIPKTKKRNAHKTKR